MSPNEVLVTYTLYPSGNGDLRNAISGIERQLPLRNLHWKSSTRTSLRTIQEVNVRLVDLGEVSASKERVSGSVLDVPLVNVCFVACDDPDIYKNNTKSFIKDWLGMVQSRRSGNTSLIILVNPPTSAGAIQSSKNVFGRDKGIIAKLRTDFNGKRDICVQLNLPAPGSSDPTVWPDVINKLKESIVLSFDNAIIEREEEVKRGEAQRVTVGWNFCPWFILKESLANSFEGVNLYEDAMVIYEELDAAFLQVQKEQKLSWLDKLGATGSKDDSLPILDTKAKPYREMLLQSSITVFDFRIYVFARQCQLLGKIGRVTEIAKRGQWFVASLALRLRESKNELPEFFVESWIFSACMTLVSHCDDWSRVDRPNGDYSGLIAYESARSELLDIARIQVERIGVASGKLPNKYPFKSARNVADLDGAVLRRSNPDKSSDIESTPPRPSTSPRPSGAQRPRLSNKTFLGALESDDVYLNLYEDLSRQALAAYEACGKVNSMVRIKADLAALAEFAEKYEPAYEWFRSLAKNCLELNVWDRVTKFALEGALKSHAELQKPHDEDWTTFALAYLRTSALVRRGDDESNGQLEAVLASLRELPDRQEMASDGVFRIHVLDYSAVFDEDVSLTRLAVEVDNALPITVAVDELRLTLDSPQFGAITYSSGPVTLQPGKQTLDVFCSSSIAGQVALKRAVVSLGSISMTTDFPKGQVIIPVHRNLLGVRTVLRMPTIIDLDQEKTAVLEVHSGKQAMRNVRIAVVSLLEEFGFMLERSTSTGNKLDLSPQNIGIGNLEADSTFTIEIPFVGSPRNDLAKAQVVVQYESTTGKECSYIDDQALDVGLPILVNVQDFFRPDMLVSSFSIASDGREYVRVGSVELKTDSPFTIESGRTKWDTPTLVTPTQPLSCLFKTIPTGEAVRPGQTLALDIQYQTVDEEVELMAQAALDSLMSSCAPLGRAVRTHIENRSAWLQQYLLFNDSKAIFNTEWQSSLPADIPTSAVESFIAALGTSAPQWRTLHVPVDIPLGRLLTTVHLKPASPLSATYEGRALVFDLELHTSFAWLGDDAAKEQPQVTYDLTANADDWVVVGRKRGIYFADSAKPERQQIVLVPVRHGSLALPPVTVQLVQDLTTPQRPSALVCETYIANAAQGVKVLPSRTGMTALVPLQPNNWEE